MISKFHYMPIFLWLLRHCLRKEDGEVETAQNPEGIQYMSRIALKTVIAQTNSTANRFGCGQEGRCSVKVNESADQTLTLSCLCTIRGCMVFKTDAKLANIFPRRCDASQGASTVCSIQSRRCPRLHGAFNMNTLPSPALPSC